MNTSVSSSLKLDGAGQLRQLHQLGELDVDREVGGRTCIALTDDEHAGRDLVVRWMHEMGLDVRVDHLGNIFRTLHSESDDGSQRPLITGFHIDPVENAGTLDGCYGVLAWLTVARAFRQAGIKPQRSIIIGASTSEEGIRYQPDMMGSLVFAGGLSIEGALDTVGIDGTRLGDELKRIGYAR